MIVELWTYGSNDKRNDADFGISFEVAKEWLEQKIKLIGYSDLDEFLDEYTWDISMVLKCDAKTEGVLFKSKCGMFGHEV